MFVVVYWWRLKPGLEDQFRAGWVRTTKAIRQAYGSLGSRLHRESDGRYIAYAQWPSEAAWHEARAQRFITGDPGGLQLMQEAMEEMGILATMTMTDDLLEPAP